MGESFQKRVKAILDDLEDAVAEINDVGSGRRGRLRVGFVSSASYTVIPEAARRFRETSAEGGSRVAPADQWRTG